MRVEVKQELVSNNGKRFSMFQYVTFKIYNKETNNLDKVICRIIGMSDSQHNKYNGYIVADNVEINNRRSHQCVFDFMDIQDIDYV